MKRSLLLSVLIIAMAAFSTGCRRSVPKPEGLPQLYPCEIEVTFGGKAIEGVGVLLRATDPDMKRWGAGGLTDGEGKVIPKTASAFAGVPKGEYIVSFSKRVTVQRGPMGDEISLIPVQYERKNSKVTIVIDEEHHLFKLELDGIPSQPSKN